MTYNKKLNKVKKVYSFWGKFPLLYDLQDIITFLGRAKTIRSHAVKKLDLKNRDKVLEVACGSGRNFKYLVQAVGKKGFILGFDYSQEMLNSAEKLCKKNNWNNIKLIQGDAAQLKIKEKNFDGVISILGVSAIPDWEDSLKKCKEVLNHNGKLVVCDAHLFNNYLRFLNPIVKLVYSRFAAWDPSKNIPEKMNKIFGNVEVKSFNLGTFFIATSIKK